MKKSLILIVGKTSSGKDTVAKYIKENRDIPMICSYTTRPMRDYEKDGVEHYFVSERRMNEILQTESVLAYVKFPRTGIQYCSTLEAMTNDTMTYIIDPNGIEWFKINACVKGVDFFSIYVDLDEKEIIRRAKNRGDSIENIKSRLSSEREMMNNFKATKGYDYIIDNSGTYYDLIDSINFVLKSEGI